MRKPYLLTERGKARRYHVTREAWLNALTRELTPTFKALGAPLPAKVRIAIGFPSRGSRGKSIGECWDSTASGDGTFEILIRPDQHDAEQVAAILAHELTHAAVGIAAGHGKAFKRIATGLGLVGKMKATTGGPEFAATVAPMLKRLGGFPHATLDFSTATSTRPKKQTTRLVKCECETCGYTVRVTRKWIDEAGAPICGTRAHGRMIAEGVDDEGEGEGGDE